MVNPLIITTLKVNLLGDENMADKTFGVKVSEELHEQVQQMIEISGLTSKEWFQKAVALAEMQSVKQGAADYSQDLSELEVHTTRIYELITNMVQRSIYLKDHAVKEVSDKLEQTEMTVGEFQEKAKAAGKELKAAQELLKAVEEEKEELSKQLHQALSTNENNQLLIVEYKEKTDTLSGLVNSYKEFAVENEESKEQFRVERTQLQTEIQSIHAESEAQKNENIELKRQIEALKTTHVNEVNRLTEKLDYEKNKALLELEKEYQQKLLQANESYTTKVQELYTEMNELRKEHEEKMAQRKEQPKEDK